MFITIREIVQFIRSRRCSNCNHKELFHKENDCGGWCHFSGCLCSGFTESLIQTAGTINRPLTKNQYIAESIIKLIDKEVKFDPKHFMQDRVVREAEKALLFGQRYRRIIEDKSNDDS